MEVFDPIWKNHEKKIEKYWHKKVKPSDTVVITGDHSWGRNLEECRRDLEFIENLSGRKILLRGNNDMFWDAKKTAKLDLQSTSCFCIIRRPASGNKKAVLQELQRSMAWKKWFIHTVTEKNGSTTVLKDM
jgi:predicted phosphohydrolase